MRREELLGLENAMSGLEITMELMETIAADQQDACFDYSDRCTDELFKAYLGHASNRHYMMIRLIREAQEEIKELSDMYYELLKQATDVKKC